MAFRGALHKHCVKASWCSICSKTISGEFFYVTWLSTTRNLGQRPDLYLSYIKKKKQNTTLSFKNSNSTGCTFMNYDFVCTILVTTGGLWLMELIHSIQLGFMFTTYWADKGSQLKQQHKYQHWKIMDLHFPNEKYSIISVKLTLCILSFHQHLYLFRVFISQPLHTRSQLGRRA